MYIWRENASVSSTYITLGESEAEEQIRTSRWIIHPPLGNILRSQLHPIITNHSLGTGPLFQLCKGAKISKFCWFIANCRRTGKKWKNERMINWSNDEGVEQNTNKNPDKWSSSLINSHCEETEGERDAKHVCLFWFPLLTNAVLPLKVQRCGGSAAYAMCYFYPKTRNGNEALSRETLFLLCLWAAFCVDCNFMAMS